MIELSVAEGQVINPALEFPSHPPQLKGASSPTSPRIEEEAGSEFEGLLNSSTLLLESHRRREPMIASPTVRSGLQCDEVSGRASVSY